MLLLSQLRTNNLVIDDELQISKVKAILNDDDGVLKEYFETLVLANGKFLHYLYCRAIPLSPEILTKCGFVNVTSKGKDYWAQKNEYHTSFPHLRIALLKGKAILTIGNDGEGIVIHDDVELHTLQNIWSDFHNGAELIIEQPLLISLN